MCTGTTTDILNRTGILIVDDEKADRESIANCFSDCRSFELLQYDDPGKLDEVPDGSPIGVCIFDNRFMDKRLRITELIDTAKDHWPNAILIIMTGYRSKLSESDIKRVDAIFDKFDFVANPDILTKEIERIIRQRMKENDWPFPPSPLQRELLFQAEGYVREIIHPHIEVIIQESLETGSECRHLLMPYDVFAACGITGQNMRFIYSVYKEGNCVYSEVLPPLNNVSLDEEMPDHLKELDDVEDMHRKKALGGENSGG